MMYSHRGYPRFPDLRPIGTPIPDSRPNRETGDFPIPDFGRIGNRGFPPPIPGQIGNRGNGNWGFPGLGRPTESARAPGGGLAPRLAPTTVEVELDDEAGFDEDKARRDAINSFENIWTNWMELAATIDWAIQDCVKHLPLWKSVDAESVTKNTRGVPQYPLMLLLQLDVLRVYELIINSPSCRLQYGRLPYVALAFLGRQASNAASESEGCHSTGQLVMSDKQTTMSNDTLEKIVCLRNSRTAVTLLKKIYVDEAKHVAHDISARLSHCHCQWQDPTSASNLAQSREADDSSMLPLSDPE